jgi:C4-dicarboxylate-specific signal transduction histidine kinase
MAADPTRVTHEGGERQLGTTPERRASSSPFANRFALLSLVLLAIVLTIDLLLPLGVAIGMLYTIVILVALRVPSPRFAAWLAVACCALVVAKTVLLPERGTTELWKVIVNRVLSMLSISLTAFLGVKRKHAETRREAAEATTRLHLADLAHMSRLQTASQLSESLAHELNQPLAALSLQAEIATATLGPSLPEVARTTLQEIADQSHRAGQILRALRRFVEKTETQRQSVDLCETIAETLTLFQNQARRAGILLEQRCPGKLKVMGDRIQLEQVLLNLLQNALDAIEGAGSEERRIRITADLEDDTAIVRVCDTGPGIAAGDHERIFDRFRSSKATGLGMGLALCRSILQAHGGQLRSVPDVPQGAVFQLTLPVQESV